MKVRLALVVALALIGARLDAQPAPDAQAKRGEALYVENCGSCHGAGLTGDPYAPPLAGPAFVARWKDRPATDLYDVMRLTMPQTFPGGLSAQQNADLLAFILQKNQLPPAKLEIPAPPAARPAAASIPAAEESGAYYTRDQAARGRVAFNEVCTPCHVIGAATAPSRSPNSRGFWLGQQHLLLNLGGRYATKYPSVYHLFRRIRDSMPSSNADSVSPATKIDILAYILQQNGFPEGKTPIPLDVPLMKTMRISAGPLEQGFERLFNGRDFTGLGFVLGPNCRPAPEGCGRTEPGATFRVQDGEVQTNGKIQGYMYTQKKYLNFTLRFDYRHVPPPDWDRGDDYFDGNSGYLLFITEHRVWPKAIEIQGNHMTVLSPIGMDAMAKYTEDHEARLKARRPAGEWQSVEIVSKDGQVKSYLNGVLVTTVTEHEFREPGHIGFQSEGSELHWRNIRIRPE